MTGNEENGGGEKMLIFKSSISSIIKKERAKERSECQNAHSLVLKKTVSDLTRSYELKMKQMTKDHLIEIKNKDREINALKNELNKNHNAYQELRRREKELDNLTSEFEEVLELLTVKVHEAIQPYYRMRAKIQAVKRSSDRKNEKTEGILRQIK
jgi:hypothetical protein